MKKNRILAMGLSAILLFSAAACQSEEPITSTGPETQNAVSGTTQGQVPGTSGEPLITDPEYTGKVVSPDSLYYAVTPFTPLETEGDEIYTPQNHLVTEDGIYLLINIRNDTKIREMRNSIPAGASSTQANQIYDDAYALYSREELYTLDASGEMQKTFAAEDFFPGKSVSVESIRKGPDGEIKLISTMRVDETTGAFSHYVQTIDKQGKLSPDVVFMPPRRAAGRENAYNRDYCWDNSGRLYIFGGSDGGKSFVDIYDAEGTFLFAIENQADDAADPWIMTGQSPLVSGDTVYLLLFQVDTSTPNLYSNFPNAITDTTYYAAIDIEGQRLEEKKLYSDEPYPHPPLSTSEKGTLLRRDASGNFHEMDLQTGEMTLFFSTSNLDINMSGFSYLPVVLSADRILLCGTRMPTIWTTANLDDRTPEWYMLERLDTNPNAGKRILSIGVFTHEDLIGLTDAIYRFNRQSQDYRAEIVDYSSWLSRSYSITYDNNYEKAYQKFLNELNMHIFSGDIPDILIDSNQLLDFPTLASGDVLADLRPLIDADSSFRTEDYLDIIFTAADSGDSLYYTFLDYYLMGILTLKEYLNEQTGWTLSEMESFIESYGNKTAFMPVEAETLLRQITNASLSDLVDISGRKADFDSDYFRQILSFCQKYSGGTMVDGEFNYQPIRTKTTLMDFDTLVFSFDNWGNIAQTAGDDFTLAGFPGEEGNHVLCVPNTRVAVMQGENTAGGWEFLTILLDKQSQNNIPSAFPVSKLAFNANIERIFANADTSGMGTLDWGNPISRESVDELRKVIQNTNKNADGNSTILNIVMEESTAYFAGQKSADDVVTIIQDRVQTYLNQL